MQHATPLAGLGGSETSVRWAGVATSRPSRTWRWRPAAGKTYPCYYY
ncbi:hypothetical protein CRUP_017598 [Coryphaenoides rupestris]|nr:hypothetical protein CRUP_017598 [Coryphaenoides rupestris]